jgi:hypothetical protein
LHGTSPACEAPCIAFHLVPGAAKVDAFPKAVDDDVSVKRFVSAVNSALAKPDRID